MHESKVHISKEEEILKYLHTLWFPAHTILENTFKDIRSVVVRCRCAHIVEIGIVEGKGME